MFCLAAFVLLWASTAQSVIISSGDGTGNVTGQGFFGWDYVGQVNGESGTYLGFGYVITANHVGPGDFTLDGTTYPWVPGSEVRLETNQSTLSDLLMFSVSPAPTFLPPLEIRTTPIEVNQFLIMIGCGRDRGPSTSWDPNGGLPPPPEELPGWSWAGTTSKRWGTNLATSLTTGLILGTVSFYTEFDESEVVLPEAQASVGDSGGAVFSIEPSGTKLAGLIYAIGPTPGQPSNTALFTNLTFVARLDFYDDQIQDVLALPEPSGALPIGAALVVGLTRRRRRS